MPSFCAVFNFSNCADREKIKSNYRFALFVKTNAKEGLKLSKMRREKWLAQILRKDLRIQCRSPHLGSQILMTPLIQRRLETFESKMGELISSDFQERFN